MLHREVVDFLGILVPPFLLVMQVVVLPLPFCCLDEIGRIAWVCWENNGWLCELTNSQRHEWVVVLQAVHNVLGEGFDVEVEGGRHLHSPGVVKINVFKALRGHHGRRLGSPNVRN